jgi:hypothetical protein
MSPAAVFEWIGLFSAAAMPLWNIPLILRILKRKSSDDISLAWAAGVEICVIGMLPSALVSQDLVLKIFGISNAVFFTCVFIAVWACHSR